MSRLPFRRIVLEFRHGAPSREAIQLTAELAQLLRLELSGRYLEDPALAQLARAPFAREFRLLERQWRELDSAGAAGSAELAIGAARRLFLQAAASASPALAGFEIVRAAAIGKLQRSADEIVAFLQDADPAAALLSSLEGVPGETRGALLLPRRQVPRRGPVVAVASGEEPAYAVAREIAAAAHAPLLRADWPVDVSSAVPADARLVVMDAARFPEMIRRIPALPGRVPVLVLRFYPDG